MSALAVKALAAIGRGEVVIVTDDEDRENEGDLMMAADAATTEALAFFLEHTSGVVCAALPGSRLDELDLPLMVSDNQEAQRTAFTVTGRPGPGHHDGHLGLRPRANAPGARRSSRRRRGLRSARPHPAAAQPPRRGARARRAHGGVGRSRPARRPPARRGALRGRHRGPARHGAAVRSSRRSPSRMGCRWSRVAELRRHRLRTERHIRQVAEAPVPTTSWHVHLPGVAVARSTASTTSPSSWATRQRRAGARPRAQRVPDW